MQFRLTYRGRLPAESRSETRAADKQRIRREMHRQLAELWEVNPFLREFLRPHVDEWRLNTELNSATPPVMSDIFKPARVGPSLALRMATGFELAGYKFLPLIGDAFEVKTACALDILFLRRDAPGGLIRSGGDIDNRIKVLLDAFKMPQAGSGFQPDAPPRDDESPFFCLVQDDSLITELKVTTDRLLTPKADDEHVHDVHLIFTSGRYFSRPANGRSIWVRTQRSAPNGTSWRPQADGYPAMEDFAPAMTPARGLTR